MSPATQEAIISESLPSWELGYMVIVIFSITILFHCVFQGQKHFVALCGFLHRMADGQ